MIKPEEKKMSHTELAAKYKQLIDEKRAAQKVEIKDKSQVELLRTMDFQGLFIKTYGEKNYDLMAKLIAIANNTETNLTLDFTYKGKRVTIAKLIGLAMKKKQLSMLSQLGDFKSVDQIKIMFKNKYDLMSYAILIGDLNIFKYILMRLKETCDNDIYHLYLAKALMTAVEKDKSVFMNYIDFITHYDSGEKNIYEWYEGCDWKPNKEKSEMHSDNLKKLFF